MKPLLVGEAPSKNEVTETPLEGRVGRRLANLAGLSYAEYLAFFDRVNLLHVRQDTKEKGFEFDRVAAAHAAHELFLNGKIVPGRTVLMLGWRVTRAFGVGGLMDQPYFTEHASHGGCRFYAVPHPSGVNRWWNDAANHRKAADFLQALVAEQERMRA